MAKRVETTSLQFEITINGERKALRTLKEIRQERRTLIKQLETQQLTQSEYNQKVRELGRLDGVLKDHRDKVRGAGTAYKSAGRSATVFGGIAQKLGGILSTAFGPLGLLIQGITFFAGMTKAAIETSQEIQKVSERINQLTGLVGEDLKEATATATALGNAFEVDVAQGVNAANAAANAYLEKGESLDKTFTPTLDKIGDRLAGLGDKGDEFLDQITEYSVQAQDAGLSMDRFFNLVTEGINKGVPTDKLIDSIKEFDIRIKTISKGQRETLERTLGKKFTDQILNDVETGKKSSIEALEEISVQIGALGEDSSATQAIVSDLFGGPGEDATASFISLIGEVDESLDSVIDTSNIYIQRKRELLQLEKESALASAELAFLLDGTGDAFTKAGLRIKTGFVTGLANVIEFIQFFPEYFGAATSSGKAFANTIIAGFEKMLKTVVPFIGIIESLTGKTFSLPKFEIENDPFAEVEEKIAAERKAFEERQRQEVLAQQGSTQNASRLQALQAEKEKYNQLGNLTTKELQKLAQLEADAQRNIEDLKIAVMEEGTSKRIAKLRLDANREIAALKGSSEQKAQQEKLIREKLEKDIANIQTEDKQKAIDEEQKVYEERLRNLEEFQAEKILLLSQEVLEGVQSGDVIDAEKELKEKLLEIEKEFLEKKKEIQEELGLPTTETQQEITDLEIEGVQAKNDAELESFRKKEEEKVKIAEATGQALNAIADLINASIQRQANEEIKALEKQKKKELKFAGDNADARARIEEKFDKKVQAVQEQAAKRQQTIAIGKALIDGALAIMRIAADTPKGDFGISTGILIAAQVIATAAQVAAIKSASFEKGGILPGLGGIAEGPSHQDGHILLVDGKTGQLRGAVEGGEPILSIKTYKNNKTIVDRLLRSSQHEGGKSIYQDGGILGAPATVPTTEVVENTVSNNEVTMLGEKMDLLIEAYREGKVLMVGEREAEIIAKALEEAAEIQLERTLA